MISGTRRSVLETLLERPKSATDVAKELDLSVQTISRHLNSLQEDNLVSSAGTRAAETRPHKLYEVNEFAEVFASFDQVLMERTVELTPAHKAVLSTLRIPQPEFHPVVFALLFSLEGEYGWDRIESIAVYGSVARGDADDESDVDVFFVVSDDVNTNEIVTNDSMVNIELAVPDFGSPKMVSESWFNESEVRQGLEAGSQFLRSALDEAIILYDPDDTLRNITNEYVEEEPS